MSEQLTLLLDEIVHQVETGTFTYNNEDALQAALAGAFSANGVMAWRELRLSDGHSRIDLFIPTAGSNVDEHNVVHDELQRPGIGIEVKIAGTRARAIAQLARYAACPEIAGLILVSTRAGHLQLPDELHGKPIRVATLIGAGL